MQFFYFFIKFFVFITKTQKIAKIVCEKTHKIICSFNPNFPSAIISSQYRLLERKYLSLGPININWSDSKIFPPNLTTAHSALLQILLGNIQWYLLKVKT